MNNFSASNFTFEDILNSINNAKRSEEKLRNPNGPDNNIVHLEKFQPGILMIMQQFLPGTKPVEVKRISFKEGQNKLSLDKNFKGVIVGTPKDETEKYHFEYVNYSEEEVENLRKKEELVNRK